jgi:F0F1-type ATP synthase delta subunit
MDKKNLEKLVQESYKDGKLDKETVDYISDRLTRNKLKQYINLLKEEERKKIIFVTTPKPLSADDKKKISELFPKKTIVENIDPKMISGIKLVENDEEYEFNLNQTFHDIIRFVSSND